jgi:undecaprenyl-diphosphatase
MPAHEYLEAFLLGIVQGIAEFLPISSSGHLVILQTLLGTAAEGERLELNIALHVGTLGSILVVFRRQVRDLLFQPRLIGALFVATLPLVVVGLTLKDQVETLFGSPLAAGCGLCVTGLLLAGAHRVREGDTALEGISGARALVVGLFQAIAVFPGVSRSGTTITAGLGAGLDRKSAAEFSFLIAIPAIAGAAVLPLWDLVREGGSRVHVGPLLFGAFTSFLVGLVALRWLLGIVARRRLHWFSLYCLVVGAAAIALGIRS